MAAEAGLDALQQQLQDIFARLQAEHGFAAAVHAVGLLLTTQTKHAGHAPSAEREGSNCAAPPASAASEGDVEKPRYYA